MWCLDCLSRGQQCPQLGPKTTPLCRFYPLPRTFQTLCLFLCCFLREAWAGRLLSSPIARRDQPRDGSTHWVWPGPALPSRTFLPLSFPPFSLPPFPHLGEEVLGGRGTATLSEPHSVSPPRQCHPSLKIPFCPTAYTSVPHPRLN